MENLFRSFSVLLATVFIFSSCEGPRGLAGLDGKDGADGKDANETCKLCHNSAGVTIKANEYRHSLHFTGKAYKEGTRNACAPCHSHQGFMDVVSNNTPSTITKNPTDPNRYVNNYIASAISLNFPEAFNCFTCHSSLHTNYQASEFFPLTSVSAVPMTMFGGSKSIDFAQTTGNLCAKCHQPRPVTASSGNLIDYSKLISEPESVYNMSSISFRTGVHYGTQAAMAAGTGGIEFGTGYENSAHKSEASCASCHIASPSGFSGGHSFVATGNFLGCNTTGCHSGMSSSNPGFTFTQDNVASKIAELADKINAIGAGHDILTKDPEDGLYHGYLDIYDANSNPDGYWRNPAHGTPASPTLTNAQFGAIINFQLVVRDGSLGIHNYPYIITLLENTIDAI